VNQITEGGKKLEVVKGINYSKPENGRIIVEADSGSYHFVSREFSSGGH